MKSKLLLLSVFFGVCLLTGMLYSASSFGAEEPEVNYIRVKTKSASIEVAEGEVRLTFETGDSKTLKEGESEGALPDAAIVSVVSGKANLNADKTVLELQEGDNVLIFIDETYRTTSVQVPNEYPNELVIHSNGETQQLMAGETYWAPTATTAKKETKTTGATVRKEAKEDTEDEDDASSPDTSPEIDDDTVREERSSGIETPPETPKRSKRKPGSN